MRIRVLAGVSLAAVILATPALAADISQRPIYKAPPMVPVAYNWTGFYVGVNAGYGFGGSGDAFTSGLDPFTSASIASGARPASASLDRSGFLGGGQIGYNWQFGSLVAGVEADLDWTDFSDRATFTNGALSTSYRQGLDYLGTVRGRLGYAWDRTLIYGTGGLAYGGVNNSVNFFGPAGQLQYSGGNDGTKTGYTLGAGIEQAFGGGWSAKLEYLYYNLGHSNVSSLVVPGSGGLGAGYNTRFEEDGHLIRIGLNYKFNAF